MGRDVGVRAFCIIIWKVRIMQLTNVLCGNIKTHCVKLWLNTSSVLPVLESDRVQKSFNRDRIYGSVKWLHEHSRHARFAPPMLVTVG